MACRLLALVTLVALAPGCLHGRGTAEEPVVTAIVLEGVKSFDPDAIVGKLATQAPTPGEGPFGFLTKAGQRLDPDALAVDKRRVEAWFRSRGYYDARVVDTRLVPDGAGRVKVVLRVNEGDPVRVRSLTISGLEDTAPARAKLGRLPLREGQVFTEADYDATRAQIDSALKTTGYATGEVVQSAHVLPSEHAVDVSYVVRPGTRYRFGPIFVAGSATVSRERIRDQAEVEIHQGDFYDETKLPRAQARVFDLGVFAGVRVTRGTPNAERAVIPIVVAVREAPFRTIRAGPGIAIEATRWEARGTAGWTHRNFFGDLRRVDTELRVGYAWLPTLLTRTKEGFVGQLTLGYRQPAAIGRSVDIATRLEIERGLESGYDFWSQRIQIAFPLRIAPRWSLVPSYNVEVYELSNVPPPSTTAGGVTAENPLLENCTREICLLSYFEQRIAWDGRDNPVNTRRGVYVSFSVQEGTNVSGYGYRYLRLFPEIRGFLPLGPRVVLASRARVGALIPVKQEGEPPIIARFYSGGPVSMRGYYTQRLSPMILQENEFVPVGGNGLADGSIELRYGLGGGWGSAFFLDAGNVSAPSGSPTAYLDALKLADLQLALGLGLRYTTPFGPVRLDIGVRLPTDFSAGVPFNDRFPTVPAYDDTPPHREPIVAIHFSIGDAF
jgi:translocation and assembly module TamA